MPTLPEGPSASVEAVRPEHAADFLRLQALWSKGQRFGLLLAVVDNPELAAALRQRLDALRPGPWLTVDKDASPVDVLKSLEAANADGCKPAHMVFELDAPRSPDWWQHANVLRERWAEAWQGPLLLWLSSTDLDLLAHHAPDLWNWRDGVFGFTATLTTAAAVALRGLEVSPLLVAGADADALRQRMVELAQLRTSLSDDLLTAAHVDLEQAQMHLHLGEWDQARHLAHRSLNAFEAQDRPADAASASLVLASTLHQQGELQEALTLLQAVAPTYQKLGDVRSLALTKGLVADIFQTWGQWDEALRIRQEEELPVYLQLGDVRSLAVTKGKIADILQARGQLDEALRIRQEEELPSFQQLGDVRAMGVTKGKIADILQARGQLDEALRVLQEELVPSFEQLGEVRGLAITKGRIAEILQARGQLDEALRIVQEEVLPVFQQPDDARDLAITKGRIANILLDRGQLDEALGILQEELLPIFQQLGDVRSMLACQSNMALAFARRGHREDGPRIARLLRAAHAAAQHLGLPEALQIEANYRKFFGRPLPPAA